MIKDFFCRLCSSCSRIAKNALFRKKRKKNKRNNGDTFSFSLSLTPTYLCFLYNFLTFASSGDFRLSFVLCFWLLSFPEDEPILKELRDVLIRIFFLQEIEMRRGILSRWFFVTWRRNGRVSILSMLTRHIRKYKEEQLHGSPM